MKRPYRILLDTLFALSLGLNCAYMTGCLSDNIGSDDHDDRTGPSEPSREDDTRLLNIARKLGVFIPSGADAKQVEEIIINAISNQEKLQINETDISPEDWEKTWESVLSTAEDMKVKEPFEQLKRASENVKRGKLVVLKPSTP